VSVSDVCLHFLRSLLNSVAFADEDDDVAAAIAADRAAEEAAAAMVEEAAEVDDDDDADAHDTEADASRFDPNDPNVFPLTDMPAPSKDVEFGYAFSSGLADGKTLTLGLPTRAVVGLSNGGRTGIHVWGVMGSLNMPHKFDMYVQNFTYSVVNQTVGVGGEMSFDYSFEPNERLDTRDFTLSLSVFYEAQGATGKVIRAHATTFMNQTITTVAGPQAVGNATFMALLIAVLLAAGGGAYYVKTFGEEAQRGATELGTATSDGKEWLEEHQSMLKGGGRAKSEKSKSR
jgi:Translocon-associated protein (TRAP), alpha subunit